MNEPRFEHWVQLAGRRVRHRDVRAQPGRYATLLAHARHDHGATCLCRPTPLPLVVRLTRSGRLTLACWPNQGQRHHPQCAFHHLAPALSGRSGYTAAAITETADTTTTIRFSEPLTSNQKAPQNIPSDATAAHTSRRSVGLLGLLHYLWEAARLNAWNPGRHRKWPARQLDDVLGDCVISGQHARDIAYVIPTYSDHAAAANLARYDQFIETLRPTAPGQLRRGFILAEIKSIHDAPHGMRYQLAHHHPRRQIFTSTAVDATLRESYRSAFSAAAPQSARRIGLFYIHRSSSGYAVALDAAIMLTNHDYIPADSTFEVQMADALAAAGRSYTKPLTFDPGTDVVLPDFILTDRDPPDFVEVWGLPGRASYEARKARKVAHYQLAGSQLIEWVVTEPLPVNELQRT